MHVKNICYTIKNLGDISKYTGKTDIQQPAVAKLYRENYTNYTYLLNATASWLQPAVINFDVSPQRERDSHSDPCYITIIGKSFLETLVISRLGILPHF